MMTYWAGDARRKSAQGSPVLKTFVAVILIMNLTYVIQDLAAIVRKRESSLPVPGLEPLARPEV